MDFITPETIAAAKAASPVAVKAVEALAKRMISSLGGAINAQLREIVTNLKTNFGPHLEITYDRCTKIKTLISRDEPVTLLAEYVPLRFRCQNAEYDDNSTIEEIRKRKRVVISGTGGGGKTIFTKYLWIALFEKPNGRVPIFIELRRLNDVGESDDSLLTFVYHTVVASHSNVTRETFNKGISSGLFAFIFDGFDEVAIEQKAEIERQLLSLASNNPECIVVVSGRPDEAFDSWQLFSNFQTQPLSKDLVVKLINKLNFDKQTKKKFITRVKQDLYEKHVSFLSTPLLATLMLLTFDQFADIPEKVHLFYEQAFETMFARHDAMKETFKRDMHTGLSIDVFKRHFSYFCLVSYHDQKFEFTEEEFREYLKRGLKIEGAEVDLDKFIRDLRESVCVVQRDGLKLVFTHRSFQEFFAAYCLSRLERKHFNKIVDAIANRRSDTVLQMLYDMNEERLTTEYIVPAIDDYFLRYESASEASAIWRYCYGIKPCRPMVSYERAPRRLELSYNNRVAIRSVVEALFVKQSADERLNDGAAFRAKDRKALKSLERELAKNKKLGRFDGAIDVDKDGSATVNLNGQKVGLSLVGTGFAEWANEVNAKLRSVRAMLASKADRRDLSIEEIFGR